MPTKPRDDINNMLAKPSPYGDQVAKAVVLLIGVAVVLVLIFHR